ncbi:hypothetical protein [Streptomyces sp. NBC_00448]|uniref:hypothetical protein n=1 Tax=Streptomyces sp. NBC_00448 TaxID=2903652 RepID=UPI002E1F6292
MPRGIAHAHAKADQARSQRASAEEFIVIAVADEGTNTAAGTSLTRRQRTWWSLSGSRAGPAPEPGVFGSKSGPWRRR